jgi:hypothetical protein
MLTNPGRQPYVVDSLKRSPRRGGSGRSSTSPGADGRAIPQRLQVGDGPWLREAAAAYCHDSATMVVAGVPGSVSAVARSWIARRLERQHAPPERVPPGWHGRSRGGARRDGRRSAHRTTRARLPGATNYRRRELPLPGEITSGEGESHATPWVYLAAGPAWMTCRRSFTATCARCPHPRPGWSTSTSGKRSTSATTSQCRRAGRYRRRRRSGTVRSTTAGSPGAAATRLAWGDWRVDEDVWPGGPHQLADYAAAASRSSGSGSSPRWST